MGQFAPRVNQKSPLKQTSRNASRFAITAVRLIWISQDQYAFAAVIRRRQEGNNGRYFTSGFWGHNCHYRHSRAYGGGVLMRISMCGFEFSASLRRLNSGHFPLVPIAPEMWGRLCKENTRSQRAVSEIVAEALDAHLKQGGGKK